MQLVVLGDRDSDTTAGRVIIKVDQRRERSYRVEVDDRSAVVAADVSTIRLSRDLRVGKHRIRVIFVPDDTTDFDRSRSTVMVLKVKPGAQRQAG